MKNYTLGLVILMLGGLLVACTDQTSGEITNFKKQIDELSSENSELKHTVMEQRKELGELKKASKDVSMNHVIQASVIEYPQSLYKQRFLDIDEDGEKEAITLYVNASKMENGVFAWDDGQKWLLAVEDEQKIYPLFDDYVQLGTVDFSLSTMDGKPTIVMFKTNHKDRFVSTFLYDKKANGFVKNTFYKKENLQEQFNKQASYAFLNDGYRLVKQAFIDDTIKALKAEESFQKDRQQRMKIFEPIAADLRHAQRLFDAVGDLNPDLYISLDNEEAFLNQLIMEIPTSLQIDKLKSIHLLFQEKQNEDLMIEEDQISPDIKKKLKDVENILKEK